MNITYKLKTANAHEILAHLKECNDDFHPPLIERVNLADYSRKLLENSVTFEAWNGNILVGLVAAYFNQNTDHSAFVTNVSVLKKFMGMGIASELLNQCVQYAISKNITKITLEVNKKSVYAINLYKKFDFVNIGDGKEFVKMKLELN